MCAEDGIPLVARVVLHVDAVDGVVHLRVAAAAGVVALARGAAAADVEGAGPPPGHARGEGGHAVPGLVGGEQGQELAREVGGHRVAGLGFPHQGIHHLHGGALLLEGIQGEVQGIVGAHAHPEALGGLAEVARGADRIV